MKVVKEVMIRNCLRKDSYLILGNMLLATELLITETCYLQIVFIVKLLILLRSISRLHLNRGCIVLKLDVAIVGNIRRKPAFTYTSTVCGIAGIGEFGECVF